MNKKLVKEFLIITFVIMIIFWGGCAMLTPAKSDKKRAR